VSESSPVQRYGTVGEPFGSRDGSIPLVARFGETDHAPHQRAPVLLSPRGPATVAVPQQRQRTIHTRASSTTTTARSLKEEGKKQANAAAAAPLKPPRRDQRNGCLSFLLSRNAFIIYCPYILLLILSLPFGQVVVVVLSLLLVSCCFALDSTPTRVAFVSPPPKSQPTKQQVRGKERVFSLQLSSFFANDIVSTSITHHMPSSNHNMVGHFLHPHRKNRSSDRNNNNNNNATTANAAGSAGSGSNNVNNNNLSPSGSSYPPLPSNLAPLPLPFSRYTNTTTAPHPHPQQPPQSSVPPFSPPPNLTAEAVAALPPPGTFQTQMSLLLLSLSLLLLLN
jgi:hypothetical protein